MLHTLPNGLTLIVQEQRSAPVVTLQMWVGVGSADETPAESGLAHVHEHMVFKGTKRRGVGEIARDVESAGGEVNAWTSFDETVYYVLMSSRFFEQGLDVVADALTNSTFDADELEREREVILEEVRRSNDMPSSQLSERLFRTAWRKHPYRRPILGRLATLARFDRGDVCQFYERHYRPENMTLVIVGDVEEGDAVRRAEALLGGFKRRGKAATVKRAKEPAQRGLRVDVSEGEVQESYVSLGWHLPDIQHPDIPAIDLLSIILGSGESSRYSARLRRGREVANEAWGYAFTPREPGLMLAGATCQPGARNARRALEGLVTESYRVGQEGVSVAEVAKARQIIESDMIQSRQTVQGQARRIGHYHLTAGSLDAEATYVAGLRAVTAEDIQRVAQDYLRNDNLTAALMQPQESKPAARIDADQVREVATAAAAKIARRKVRAGSGAGGPGVTAITLPSGIRLVVQPSRSVAMVSMRAVWQGGGRYEAASQAGLNNLLARCIVRGTKQRSGDAMAEQIEAMGANLDAFSGRNSFGFSVDALSRNFEQTVELFAETLLQPALDDAEVARERNLVLQDINARQDNLAGMCFELFHRTLYERHPYRLPINGDAEQVKKLESGDLRRFLRRYYKPGAMTVAVVGGVDVNRVAALLNKQFGEKPLPGARGPKVQAEGPLEGLRKANEARTREQAHIVVGFPSVDMHHRDRAVLQVLAAVLSGQGGRLFLELRDKRSLAYSLSAFNYEGIDPGYFGVYIGTATPKRHEAVAGILDELAGLAAGGITDAELQRAQRYIVGVHDISLQRNGARAATMALSEAYGMGWEEMNRSPDRILKVTKSAVKRVARALFQFDPARYVVASVAPDLKLPGGEGA